VWFVGVLNGPTARTLKINLSFLAGSGYDALIVRDKIDDPAAVVVEKSDKPGASLTVDMRASGGAVVRLTPRSESLIPDPKPLAAPREAR